MRPILTDRVAWSVCLLVCDTSEPCKTGCTDRAAFWVEDLGGPGEPCIRWGSRFPHGKGQIFGGEWYGSYHDWWPYWEGIFSECNQVLCIYYANTCQTPAVLLNNHVSHNHNTPFPTSVILLPCTIPCILCICPHSHALQWPVVSHK